MARPKIEIDLEQVAKLAKIQCTDLEIAYIMGISPDTIQRRMKDETSGFAVAYKKGRAEGRVSLRRLQYQGAEAGNPTMLVWLGKQYLGQGDVIREHHVKETVTAITAKEAEVCDRKFKEEF